MAVYTSIDESEIRAFLAVYDIGAYRAHEGIAAGIENTNYLLDTSDRRYVLTVFEQSAPQSLRYCLDLMEFLAADGFPCARPQARLSGDFLGELKGKPAVVVEHLRGRSVRSPPAHSAMRLVPRSLDYT